MRYKPTYGDKQRESARLRKKDNPRTARVHPIEDPSKHELPKPPAAALLPAQPETRLPDGDRPSN